MRKKLGESPKKRIDYYPFGMPMPNRNVEGNYRYGYQGEFAEKEPELGGGVNSFQLRLWDSRIGRWLSPDPYSQYHSPYLGMGNNPINGVDPDGGCFIDNGDGTQSPCPDNMAVGSTIMGTDGFEYTMGESNVWWSDAAYEQFGANLNYSQSIGEFVPNKINFNTMADAQIIDLAIDWFSLINRVEEKKNGDPFNVVDLIDKQSLMKPQGDRIDRFFGSMTVSSLETNPSNSPRFVVLDKSTVQTKSHYGNIGFIQQNDMEPMKGFTTKYRIRARDQQGQNTIMTIYISNKEQHENIHNRIFNSN